MAQEVADHTLEVPEQRIVEEDGRSSPFVGEPSLSRSESSSRLNAMAPEFVPRAAALPMSPQKVQIQHHGHPHAVMPQTIHVYHASPQSPRQSFPAPVPNYGAFDYHGGGGNGGGFPELEVVPMPPEQDPVAAAPGRDANWDEVAQRVVKQVEYYFSDLNLATTEHLMRFISRDPDGYVPISVIASFRKIKASVHNIADLASALRTSTKLVVSEDDKKVRRQQPFTEADVEELQSRIIVADNLPEDHCYQNLKRIFSVAGRVKTIRTCYPQTSNGTAAPNAKPSKMDVLFGNKLHAFVEYETMEDAERAVTDLNDEGNWRSGLRVRLLLKFMKRNGAGRAKKGGHEGDENGEEDVSTSDQLRDKPVDDLPQPSETALPPPELVGDEVNDREGGIKRGGKGRGRGARGRGRGQQHYTNNSRSGGHPVGTPPSSNPIHPEQPLVPKQPPGPRMPDGTRGFTMGRGKPLASTSG